MEGGQTITKDVDTIYGQLISSAMKQNYLKNISLKTEVTTIKR